MSSSDLRFWLQNRFQIICFDIHLIKKGTDGKTNTHTLENMDKMVGCFPVFLVTLELAGDSGKAKETTVML